ncbi:hypothetical protein CLAFUW4_14187 [Fulvia fulva]|uniref:uncharacterized protein n=1 Tax=Passalora fulva TaxID=5499 RepID=UPI0028529664|nr:uncharacterized protein CLAFUR5_20375 [Fulvia fulva]KAK4610174.1 hypothetical protein CLAFUR4_14190 [Fulvia fulva]KAK4611380.1 hypothetical protein CLAFUR0_14194 [Fulvia fulva]WMI39090.1 hypothetical protein CLAFUR5_20375 [Fulvia fulva]WPV22170.1 hypothetical protein CLAFUW4_14187 [Fulvia fulva]WPV37046.1 hypothetical protein CLAFUW7_14198 [Fulvia fulva]
MVERFVDRVRELDSIGALICKGEESESEDEDEDEDEDKDEDKDKNEDEDEDEDEDEEMKDAVQVTEQSDAIHATETDVAVDDDCDSLFGEPSDDFGIEEADSGYNTEHAHVTNVDASDYDENLDDDVDLNTDEVQVEPAQQASLSNDTDDDILEAQLEALLAEPEAEAAEEDEDDCKSATSGPPDLPSVVGSTKANPTVEALHLPLTSAQDSTTGHKRKRRDSDASSKTKAPAPKRAKVTAEIAPLEETTVREQIRNGTFRKLNKLPAARDFVKRLEFKAQSYARTWPLIETALKKHFDALDAAAAPATTAQQAIAIPDEDSDEDAVEEWEDVDLGLTDPTPSNKDQRSQDDDNSEPARPTKRTAWTTAQPEVPTTFGARARLAGTFRGAIADESRLIKECGPDWRQAPKPQARRSRHKKAA